MLKWVNIEKLNRLWNGELSLPVTFFGYWLFGGLMVWLLVIFGLLLLSLPASMRCGLPYNEHICLNLGYLYFFGLVFFLPVTMLHSGLLLRPVYLSSRKQGSTLFSYLAVAIVLMVFLFPATVMLIPNGTFFALYGL